MATPQLVLAHGASGTAASMMPWVAALRRRDIAAAAIDIPRGNAERARLRFAEQLDTMRGAAIGGHSFGGRVASLLAAEEPVPALVLLSYPLHRPGHTEELRTEHWPRIRCPVLVLSGESDPFARIDLLQQQVRQLSDVRLFTWPGVGHGLLPVVDEAAGRIADFLQTVTDRP